METLYLGRDLSYLAYDGIDGIFAPFQNNSTLTSVTIGDSVTAIGDYLFSGSMGIKELNIGNSVTRIGNYAFWCCGAQSITIPNNVTSIGDYAFHGCSNLENLYIGTGVSYFGSRVFDSCNNLLEIKMASKKAITAGTNTFCNDAYNNACLYIPTGRQFAYEKTTPWSNFYIKEMDFESETENGSNITGDVNNDGAVNVADVTKLVNIILGNE